MTICRFFERGCCRYGDRCRFEHIQRDSDSNNYYNQRRTGYSNYNDDYQQQHQRYESQNYYENKRNYSPERYQNNYRYQSPERYGDNYRHNSAANYRYQSSGNEHTYGTNQQYQRGNENVYSQNRYQWLSDEYQKQTQPQQQQRENKYAQNSYITSTPKSKVAFSFKVPESEIKRDAGNFMKFSERDQLEAEKVKEDAKAWELGGQWPFSSYFPWEGKHGYPSFYDVSPEELRYAAYNAEKNNTYQSYVQGVKNALMQVNQQRSNLQVITPQLLETITRIRNGEDLYSTSKLIDPLSSSASIVPSPMAESMEMAAAFSSTPISTAAAAFSFKLPSETDSAPPKTATNFSFRLPPGTEIKAVGVPGGDENIYTPMANLTNEEREQFCASTFVLGKIPTKPPPLELCT